MADIFLSYASEDRERVAELVEAFERQGWSVWWDQNIGAGQHFDSVIEEQIQAARCVVVAWTQHSIDADWVRSEALEAMEREILVPVRLDNVRLPMAFRRVQTVDLMGWPGRHDQAQYKRLIGSVATFIAGTLQANPERVLDRPSLAVLPFTNMSSDPEGEFIADGLTEDLITSLSNTFDMFVIARNSSFSYKGRAVDVREVGRELGVSYVLEGSIRRFKEGTLRITAQLTETESGTHVWAEKYDRSGGPTVRDSGRFGCAGRLSDPRQDSGAGEDTACDGGPIGNRTLANEKTARIRLDPRLGSDGGELSQEHC